MAAADGRAVERDPGIEDELAPAPAAPAQAQQASPPAQGRAPQPGQARTAQAAPVMPASQQVATAAPVPKRIRPSEPSEIEIRQVDTRAKSARP